MAKIKIWHNPRCSKSRAGLQYLHNKELEVEVFEYMKDEIDPAELARLIEQSGQPLEEFIRTNEPEYKALGLKGQSLTVEAFAKIAAEHPRLLQRPIIVKGDKAILGRPAARIDEIL
ncbi:MAG: arsenate reductase (glutaredoxin) [bacterium]